MKLEDINGNEVNVTKRDIIWNALHELRYLCPHGGTKLLTVGFPAKTIEVTSESLDAVLDKLRKQFA